MTSVLHLEDSKQRRCRPTGGRLIKASLATLFALVVPHAAWGQSAVWLPQGATTGSIYYNGGNVGIGTTFPYYKVHVYGNVNAPIAQLTHNDSGGNSAYAAYLLMTDTDGGGMVKNSSTNPSNGGPGSLNIGNTGAYPVSLMTNNSSRLWVGASGSVGIGTTNPVHLLHVAGTIGAQEVIVSTTGADYVFAPNYHLRPLAEVAAYIKANHHLPDVPSAAEMKEKGMGVSEMQAKLLAKIEELTLHMIRQEKENKELRDRIAQIEAVAKR